MRKGRLLGHKMQKFEYLVEFSGPFQRPNTPNIRILWRPEVTHLQIFEVSVIHLRYGGLGRT